MLNQRSFNNLAVRGRPDFMDYVNRFEKHIRKLQSKGFDTENIEKTITEALENLKSSRSFVIYGEPQSGKTEMMIALTAKLLDEGHKIIIILLNDSISLLNQNLERFSRSGLSPTPKNFTEILKPEIDIGDKRWIIFSKKNSKDLTRLKDKLRNKSSFVVIDDEADYATPNAKINKKNERTKINQLINDFVGTDGIYIGVTATPARLDLNNTLNNDKDKWICFDPHSSYKGHKVFFPIRPLTKSDGEFRLKYIPEGYDNGTLRKSLFSFLVNVAYLNLCKQNKNVDEGNYSFLIHTSGNKSDHEQDEMTINCIFNMLTDTDNSSEKRRKYYDEIYQLSENRFEGNGGEITKYIEENSGNHRVIVMNSDQEKNFRNNQMATKPVTLFTIIIGGNIVSRGVTFENLLSMFFTRGVKHKMQQDTYVQRARMFGHRNKEHLKYFELTIPEQLYLDWHRCFLFHTLALESIKSGQGAPVWIEIQKSRPVATSSIDKAKLQFNRGEMSFSIFAYNDDEITNIVQSNADSLEKLQQLQNVIEGNALPEYLINFIKNYSENPNNILIHPSASIDAWNIPEEDKKNIYRSRGFMGKRDIKKDKYPFVRHHLKIYFYKEKARLFYKYVSPDRITFLSIAKN